jgi:hypothetical protein
MGIWSSALHKVAAWKMAMGEIPGAIPTALPIHRKAEEEDVIDPKAVAIGKLRKFSMQSNLAVVAPKLDNNATATAVDVLFVAKERVLTTDREREGAALAIGALGELMWSLAAEGNPAEMGLYHTAGTARISEIIKYGKDLPEDLILAEWLEGRMTLSPAIIGLLYKPKRLFAMHSEGIVGSGIVNPNSIGGINWVELARWTPQIARARSQEDIWIELDFGRHQHYFLDKQTREAEEPASILETWARGIPSIIAQGIANRFLN